MIRLLRTHYPRVKPYVPVVCFFSGSIWDSITLRRIDNLWDIGTVSIFLFFSSIIIILMGRWKSFKYARFYPAAVQFLLGSIFSACTVYYFKSTSSLPQILFFLGLAGLLIGNEFLHKKYSAVHIAFVFWCIASFMVFNYLTPIMANRMNWKVFLLGVSAAYACCYIVQAFSGNRMSLVPVTIIYTILALLYFTNVIPPVPLAKKDLAMFHSVVCDNHSYNCTMEEPRWYEFLKREITIFIMLQETRSFVTAQYSRPCNCRSAFFTAGTGLIRENTNISKWAELDTISPAEGLMGIGGLHSSIQSNRGNGKSHLKQMTIKQSGLITSILFRETPRTISSLSIKAFNKPGIKSGGSAV